MERHDSSEELPDIPQNIDQNQVDYEVEGIIDKKCIDGCDYYLVRWVGYPPDSDSWEPRGNLDCHELLKIFERKRKKASSTKQCAKSSAILRGSAVSSGIQSAPSFVSAVGEQGHSNSAHSDRLMLGRGESSLSEPSISFLDDSDCRSKASRDSERKTSASSKELTFEGKILQESAKRNKKKVCRIQSSSEDESSLKVDVTSDQRINSGCISATASSTSSTSSKADKNFTKKKSKHVSSVNQLSSIKHSSKTIHISSKKNNIEQRVPNSLQPPPNQSLKTSRPYSPTSSPPLKKAKKGKTDKHLTSSITSTKVKDIPATAKKDGVSSGHPVPPVITTSTTTVPSVVPSFEDCLKSTTVAKKIHVHRKVVASSTNRDVLQSVGTSKLNGAPSKIEVDETTLTASGSSISVIPKTGEANKIIGILKKPSNHHVSGISKIANATKKTESVKNSNAKKKVEEPIKSRNNESISKRISHLSKISKLTNVPRKSADAVKKKVGSTMPEPTNRRIDIVKALISHSTSASASDPTPKTNQLSPQPLITGWSTSSTKPASSAPSTSKSAVERPPIATSSGQSIRAPLNQPSLPSSTFGKASISFSSATASNLVVRAQLLDPPPAGGSLKSAAAIPTPRFRKISSGNSAIQPTATGSVYTGNSTSSPHVQCTIEDRSNSDSDSRDPRKGFPTGKADQCPDLSLPSWPDNGPSGDLLVAAERPSSDVNEEVTCPNQVMSLSNGIRRPPACVAPSDPAYSRIHPLAPPAVSGLQASGSRIRSSAINSPADNGLGYAVRRPLAGPSIEPPVRQLAVTLPVKPPAPTPLSLRIATNSNSATAMSASSGNAKTSLASSSARIPATKKPASESVPVPETVAAVISKANSDLNDAVVKLNVKGVERILLSVDSKQLDLEQANSRGSTLLMRAAMVSAGAEILRMLIERGADLNAVVPINGRTPLILACEGGLERNVDVLLEHGAYMDVRTVNSLTSPLMEASARGHLGIVKLLLGKGASFSLRNAKGQTALDILKIQPNRAIENYLVHHIENVKEEVEDQIMRMFASKYKDDRVFKIIGEIFPVHCFALNEGSSEFHVHFKYKPRDDGPDSGILLFFGHTLISSSRIQSRFHGPSAVKKVFINSLPLKSCSNKSPVFSMPLSDDKATNDLCIVTEIVVAAEVKLLVWAIKGALTNEKLNPTEHDKLNDY